MFSGIIENIQSELVKVGVLLFWKPWSVKFVYVSAGSRKAAIHGRGLKLYCFINETKKKPAPHDHF